MPQIKKANPIYFKPSHEAAAALTKLMERYPGMTRTAVIEMAITERLRYVNANPGMFMLDEYHGPKGPETMVSVVHDLGPLVDEMHVQTEFVSGKVAAEYIKQMSDGLLEKGLSHAEFSRHLKHYNLDNHKHLTADELNKATLSSRKRGGGQTSLMTFYTIKAILEGKNVMIAGLKSPDAYQRKLIELGVEVTIKKVDGGYSFKLKE